MATFREKIVSFVDDHWFVPCDDDIVWVKDVEINTRMEIANHKKHTKKDWAATFLHYTDLSGDDPAEGLYLIPPSDLAKVKGGQFDCNL
jgi:hypothetical protein